MNIQAILADKWVRISGGILAVIFAITFLPAIFGWIPDGGLVFLNIVLALVLFNVVVQRHPIMSLRWLYGIDLGLGVFLLLAALPDFSESAMAGITALILIPLNCWIGFQFIKELGRKSSLQGKFLPAQEGGLSLDFTVDGNLILSNGTVYRYATRRNDLLLYDGDTLATKWDIVKCDLKTLMVKDDQGTLHEYKRDFTAVKNVASGIASGLGSAWGAVNKFQDTNRLRAKWTPQDSTQPSIEFTEDGAFVRSDGKAGKYTVDWDSKVITVTLTDKAEIVFEIVSLSPSQLVLSSKGVASTYTTTMGKRLGLSGSSSASAPSTQPTGNQWEIPASDKRPSFIITNSTKSLAFDGWRYDPKEDRLASIVTALTKSNDYNYEVAFFDASGVQLGDHNLVTSTTLERGRQYEARVYFPVSVTGAVARLVIRKRK
jgi:hypothetical protein